MIPLRVDWPKYVTALGGIVAVACGAFVLAAWYAHYKPLIQLSPNWAPMQRMTALEFVLCGISLVLLSVVRKRTARVLALVALSIAALVVLEYALAVDLGIDQLLGRDYVLVRTSSPGRMSPIAAFGFLLTGVALVVLSARKAAKYGPAVAGILGAVVAAIGAMGTFAYALGNEEAYGWGYYTRAGLLTVTSLIFVGVGTLACAWLESGEIQASPRWLPISLGLGLGAGAVALWHALTVHREGQIPMLSQIVLGAGIAAASLIAITISQTQRARLRSRQLQEGKEAFERLFEASPDALLVVDFQGRIVEANQRAESTFGYTRKELLALSLEILVPEVLRDPHRAHRQGYYSDPKTRSMGEGLDLNARRKDGSQLPVDVSLSPLQHRGEMQVLAAVRDITERRQAEEALRESEERFRGVFENSPLGLALIRPNFQLVKVNASLCRISGYSEAELVGRNPLESTHPDDYAESRDFAERLFKGEIPYYKIDKRYIKKNGDVIWATMTATLLRDHEGRPLLGIGTLEDITERKRAEKELLTLTQRLSLATRSASIAVWEWNLVSRLGIWDDTMFQIFGIPRKAQITRDDWAPLIHPEDLARTKAFLGFVIHNKTQQTVEFRIIRPDGSLRHITAAGGPVEDKNGNVNGVVGIALDITERKQLEQDLEDARVQAIESARLSALGTMAGGVAHEINNPLSIIHALASDLSEMVADQGSVPVQVVASKSAVIRETAERIAKIVKSLRQISREGASDPFRPTALAKIVAETLEICRAKFKAHEVELILPPAIPRLTVWCREVQIAQALLNLLQNALDATLEQQGERWVQLKVEPGDDSVALLVIDSGPGVPVEIRPRLMEPFFTTKPVGKGTGLGLSLSKTIAEDHGGSLEYREDQGHTCFSLALPLPKKAEAA
jgi:PAS domain S-box-containing protein